MLLFEESHYKPAIRNRLKSLRSESPQFTLRRLAEKIPIQYTYLSRALNDEHTHLKADHLYCVSQFLKLLPDETEFLFLLYEKATSAHPDRIAALDKKIQATQKERILRASVARGEGEPVSAELAYLLDPLSVVVHVSLSLAPLAKQPSKLCGLLGLSEPRLKQILGKLSRLGLIEQKGETVTRVHKSHIHYSPDHPLMRSHQEIMRAMSHGRLLELAEEDKRSFMVTFSADPATVAEMRRAFDELVRRFERLALDSRQQHTYQLNFDLFKWL